MSFAVITICSVHRLLCARFELVQDLTMRDSDSDDSDLTPLSSPLTSLASSPEPPDFLPPQFINPYLTPASSQDHSACNSGSEKEQDRRKRARANDELPLAKKRKTAEVIPRTTVHLDLRASKLTPIEPSAQLDLLLKVLRKRRKIVVIAGAGISTSAGGMTIFDRIGDRH